jgi:hypothetical protein
MQFSDQENVVMKQTHPSTPSPTNPKYPLNLQLPLHSHNRTPSQNHPLYPLSPHNLNNNLIPPPHLHSLLKYKPTLSLPLKPRQPTPQSTTHTSSPRILSRAKHSSPILCYLNIHRLLLRRKTSSRLGRPASLCQERRDRRCFAAMPMLL